MCVSLDSYECFSLQFSDGLNQIVKKIHNKIGRKLTKTFTEIPHFISQEIWQCLKSYKTFSLLLNYLTSLSSYDDMAQIWQWEWLLSTTWPIQRKKGADRELTWKKHVHELAVRCSRAKFFNFSKACRQGVVHPGQHVMPTEIIWGYICWIHVDSHFVLNKCRNITGKRKQILGRTAALTKLIYLEAKFY